MRVRRIFRPAYSPRRWGPAAMGLGALAGAVVIAVALPGDLFGSAPRDQEWMAKAADIRVLDGETLRLGDRMLQLQGVRAPERGQTCRTAAGNAFDCGAATSDALAKLVADRDLACRLNGKARHGRAIGICRAGGVEVNASLVAAGWAATSADAPASLAALEAAARDARRGVWASPSRPDGWR